MLLSKSNKASISKIYLEELKIFKKYAMTHKNDNLEQLSD